MKHKATALAEVSNDAAVEILQEQPYTVEVTIAGTAAFLFHKWSCEAVAEKSAARKGSAAKKEDNLESYVYRNEKGVLAIPGEYLRASIVQAARYLQDPRSPRKSAMDLFKAGVVVLTELASTGSKSWDYIDRRRVMIQRSAITRCRPALLKGWKVTIQLMVLSPEYIPPQTLNSAIQNAGKLIGLGDFRPTFGRFNVVQFKRL